MRHLFWITSFVNCLIYADDLVLISRSELGLQGLIDKLSVYCKRWRMEVYNDKTKIMKFNKGARWRSGRASASESRGPGFDPHRRHRVVSLSKAH